MKKSILSLTALAGTILMLGTGCQNIETNRVGEQLEIKVPVIVQPTVETNNQIIQGSATVHSILGIFAWGPSTQAVGINYGFNKEIDGGILGDLLSFTSKSEIVARNAAAYDATKSANADLILAPQYTLTTKDYFFYKSISCEVKGYPGFLKGVKIVEPEKKDINLNF